MAVKGRLRLFVVMTMLACGVGGAWSQVSAAGSAATTGRATQENSQKKTKAKKRGSGATQVIPLETAPATAPTAASTAADARQKAADQALLQQQQAQSAAGARVTDQQVQRAEKQIDRQQNEVRIQDAPGPAQTGVPGPTGLTQPVNVNPDQRIQDAPGPAQTLPALAVPLPAVPSAPATPPVAPSTAMPPQG